MRAALTLAEAAALLPDGAAVMIGGFMGVGSPHRIIDALIARKARGLTVIANDTAPLGVGIGKLISAGFVTEGVVSHIETNPETQRLISIDDVRAATSAPLLVPDGVLEMRLI